MQAVVYRLVEHDDVEHGKLAVHEIYYNEDDEILAYSEEPITLDDFETYVECTKFCAQLMSDILNTPVFTISGLDQALAAKHTQNGPQ